MNKTRKTAVITCLFIIIASTLPAFAEEELKVRGVTIVVIDKFPVFDYLDERRERSSIPSCERFMTEESRDKLAAKLNSSDLQAYNIVGGLCKSHGVKFKKDDIDFTFDGNWLTASIEVINDEEWVPIGKAIPLVKEKKNELKMLSCDLAEEYIANDYCGSSMVLIHIKEIQPLKILIDDSDILGKYRSVRPNSVYADDLSDLLDVGNSTDLKMIAAKVQSESNYTYSYYLRDDTEIKEVDFGQFMIIMNYSYSNYPMHLENGLFQDAFLLSDCYWYYQDEIRRAFELPLSSTESLIETITERRKDLLEKTGPHVSWKNRLDYLRINKNRLLLGYEEDYEKIDNDLDKWTNFYENEEKEFKSSGVSPLYAAEIEPQLSEFSDTLEKIEEDLMQSEDIQNNIREIYYGELTAALNEQVIQESWDMTVAAINESHKSTRDTNLLAIIIAFFGASFTFVITSYFVNKQIKSSEELMEKQSSETNQLLTDFLDAQKQTNDIIENQLKAFEERSVRQTEVLKSGFDEILKSNKRTPLDRILESDRLDRLFRRFRGGPGDR